MITAGASVISGLEVAYEHYRGSYSRRVMYTPVILSATLGFSAMISIFIPQHLSQGSYPFLFPLALLPFAFGIAFPASPYLPVAMK